MVEKQTQPRAWIQDLVNQTRRFRESLSFSINSNNIIYKVKKKSKIMLSELYQVKIDKDNKKKIDKKVNKKDYFS